MNHLDAVLLTISKIIFVFLIVCLVVIIAWIVYKRIKKENCLLHRWNNIIGGYKGVRICKKCNKKQRLSISGSDSMSRYSDTGSSQSVSAFQWITIDITELSEILEQLYHDRLRKKKKQEKRQKQNNKSKKELQDYGYF